MADAPYIPSIADHWGKQMQASHAHIAITIHGAHGATSASEKVVKIQSCTAFGQPTEIQSLTMDLYLPRPINAGGGILADPVVIDGTYEYVLVYDAGEVCGECRAWVYKLVLTRC